MSAISIIPLPSEHMTDHAIYVQGVLAGFILGPSPIASCWCVDNSVRPDLLPDLTGQATVHDSYADAAAIVTHAVERRAQ